MMGLLTLEKNNPRSGRGYDSLEVGETMTFVSKEQRLQLLRVRLKAGEGSIQIPYLTSRPSVKVFRTKIGRSYLDKPQSGFQTKLLSHTSLASRPHSHPPRTCPTEAKRLDPL